MATKYEELKKLVSEIEEDIKINREEYKDFSLFMVVSDKKQRGIGLIGDPEELGLIISQSLVTIPPEGFVPILGGVITAAKHHPSLKGKASDLIRDIADHIENDDEEEDDNSLSYKN